MENKEIQILLVDDEPNILEILEYNLSKEGYQISLAENGKQALKKAKKINPHLVILDMMMPGMDGIETCKKMRKIPAMQNSIITFLTALSEDLKEMQSYEAGADDYITKPIRPKVLVSKVKALLRRFKTIAKNQLLISGDLSIDQSAFQLQRNGENIHLPRKEFEMLVLLISQEGKVFSREEILEKIWGKEVIVGDRTVDVHIRKLREKIGKEKIITVTGIGYKYVV